jgi:ligand-binding SRPBCC domain-containing protein
MDTVRKLHRRQTLPLTLAEAWAFFSNPMNLSGITPKEMGFEVLSTPPKAVYPGLMLHYHVRILPFLRTEWLTEITVVREGEMFVDEQRLGPYRLWHHEHHFRAVAGGVEMEDIVHYALPMGWLGRMVAGPWVDRQLEDIFDFRRKTLEARFPGPARSSTA